MIEFTLPLRPLWQVIDTICRKGQSFRTLIICNEQNDCGGNDQVAMRSQLAKYPSADDTINI